MLATQEISSFVIHVFSICLNREKLNQLYINLQNLKNIQNLNAIEFEKTFSSRHSLKEKNTQI